MSETRLQLIKRRHHTIRNRTPFRSIRFVGDLVEHQETDTLVFGEHHSYLTVNEVCHELNIAAISTEDLNCSE